MIRPVAAVLLVLYTGVVYNLTLMDPSSGLWAFSAADRLATGLSNGHLDWSQTEVLANVALFVPAGFLLSIVVGRVWLGIALAVLGSVLIEVLQYGFLPTRVPTVMDVEHNAYGALLGAVLAWPLIAVAAPRLRSADR